MVRKIIPLQVSNIYSLQIDISAAAAALRGVAIQTSRARAAFPTRTFARLPTPLSNASAAGALHGYAP